MAGGSGRKGTRAELTLSFAVTVYGGDCLSNGSGRWIKSLFAFHACQAARDQVTVTREGCVTGDMGSCTTPLLCPDAFSSQVPVGFPSPVLLRSLEFPLPLRGTAVSPHPAQVRLSQHRPCVPSEVLRWGML